MRLPWSWGSNGSPRLWFSFWQGKATEAGTIEPAGMENRAGTTAESSGWGELLCSSDLAEAAQDNPVLSWGLKPSSGSALDPSLGAAGQLTSTVC